MSWPARMAFSSWGTTVSSKPSTPGTSGLSGRDALAVLRRISSATGTDAQPEARSSPRERGRSAGGLSRPAPESTDGSRAQGRPWAEPKRPRSVRAARRVAGSGPAAGAGAGRCRGGPASWSASAARRAGQRAVAPLGQGDGAAQPRAR